MRISFLEACAPLLLWVWVSDHQHGYESHHWNCLFALEPSNIFIPHRWSKRLRTMGKCRQVLAWTGTQSLEAGPFVRVRKVLFEHLNVNVWQEYTVFLGALNVGIIGYIGPKNTTDVFSKLRRLSTADMIAECSSWKWAVLSRKRSGAGLRAGKSGRAGSRYRRNSWYTLGNTWWCYRRNAHPHLSQCLKWCLFTMASLKMLKTQNFIREWHWVSLWNRHWDLGPNHRQFLSW